MHTLNSKALHKRLLGDKALVEIILGEFVRDLPGQLRALTEAVQDGDIDRVTKQAHKIRGAAGNIGAEHLEAVMLKIERAVADNNFAMLADLTGSLHNQLTEIQRAAEEIL